MIEGPFSKNASLASTNNDHQEEKPREMSDKERRLSHGKRQSTTDPLVPNGPPQQFRKRAWGRSYRRLTCIL